MKKILITLLLVTVMLSVILIGSGCSQNNPLSKMSAVWNSRESCVYTVYDADYDAEGNENIKAIGSMEMTIRTITTSQAVSLGRGDLAKSVTCSYCYFSQITLSLSNSDDEVVSQAIFNKTFTPIASYKRTIVGDKTEEYAVSYEGTNAVYTRIVDGERSEGSIKLSKGSYFDNEAMYFAARASRPENGESVSFTVPSIETGLKETVTIASGGSGTIPFVGVDTEAYSVRISVTNRYTPASFYCYIAKDPMTFTVGERDYTIDKPVLKIVDSGYYYRLVRFSEVVED